MDLEEKFKKSLEIIRQESAKAEKPFISWTGGKDSITGDAELYYKRNGVLCYSKIEDLFQKVTPRERYSRNGKELIIPKEKIEVLSLRGKKRRKAKVIWRSVKALIRHQTEKKILRFECSTDLSIKSTGDHSLIKAGSEYLKAVEARNLTEENSLVGINDLNFDVPDLQEVKSVDITDKILVLIGLWLADGCYATNRKLIISSGNDQEVINFLHSLERELTYQEKIYLDLIRKHNEIPKNISLDEAKEIARSYPVSFWTVYKAKDRKDYVRKRVKETKVNPTVKENGDVWICSKPLVKQLKQLGLRYDNEGKKQFPDWLLMSSNRQIGLFLAGFVQGDGSCPNDSWVSISNNNLEIIKKIRILLRRLGVQHSFSRHTTASSGFKASSKYQYSVKIQNLQGKEKFLESVPPIFSKWKNLKIEGRKSSKYPISSRKIRSIRELKQKKRFVYDLEVKDTSVFIANGLACHNSTLLVWLTQEALGESLPALFLDSGVEFEKVYDFVEKWSKKWNIPIHRASYSAKTAKQARFDKIRALKKAVKKTGCDLLFVGIRRDEHPVRAEAEVVEERAGIKRVHPILDWNEDEVWQFIKKKDIPYCKLYDEGYRSLGEKPFTGKSKGSERSGREQDKEAVMKRLRDLGYF